MRDDLPEALDRLEPITAEELQRRLLDPEVPDEALRPFLMLDAGQSRPFDPAIRANPSLVLPPEGVAAAARGALRGTAALGTLNGAARWRRHQRYRNRIAGGWSGPRVVSEGDSWFQYPFLVDDVVDHLWRDHAVLSLDAAGDTLHDMLRQDELVGAVAAERPDAVLLSGGGNDLLGNGRLALGVRPFAPGRAPRDYLAPAFEQILETATGQMRQLLRRIRSVSRAPVLVHAYDRAIPAGGRWLGRPLESLGIRDPALQRQIVAAIVDRWHGALAALAREPGSEGRLRVLDTRGVVPSDAWYDELHPDGRGFAPVAELFRRAIRETRATPHRAPAGALAGLGMARDAESAHEAEGAAALAMAAAHDEAVLLHEIGRRAQLARLPAAGFASMGPRDALAIPDSSLEGLFGGHSVLGRRIVDRAHRELHELLCGGDPEDEADRRVLRDAFGIGQGAVAGALVAGLVSGPLALSAAVAVPVAALLVRRFLKPGWTETCRYWGEVLDAPPPPARSAANPHRFCIAFAAPGADGPVVVEGGKAAVSNEAKWPLNAEIRIRFLEGSDHLKARVRHYAEAWIAPGMAALSFRWVDRGEADIRVAFRQGNGSWSMLGTECRRIADQSEPTMNYGWLTDDSPEPEIREVVLHEFGHALGLIHEHQNPAGGIHWDEAAVIRDLSGPPNMWDEETIRDNVLRHYTPDAVTGTGLDPHSIMMYPIPEAWTAGDFHTGFNTDLSTTDRALIRAAYPSMTG